MKRAEWGGERGTKVRKRRNRVEIKKIERKRNRKLKTRKEKMRRP